MPQYRVRPLDDWVAVRKDPPPDEICGLLIPESAQKRPKAQPGTIVSLGPGRPLTRGTEGLKLKPGLPEKSHLPEYALKAYLQGLYPMESREGQEIWYIRQSAIPFELNGIPHVFVQEKNIVAER